MLVIWQVDNIDLKSTCPSKNSLAKETKPCSCNTTCQTDKYKLVLRACQQIYLCPGQLNKECFKANQIVAIVVCMHVCQLCFLMVCQDCFVKIYGIIFLSEQHHYHFTAMLNVVTF